MILIASSSKISTFNSNAFLNFEPALSPANNMSVLEETEETFLPPFSLITSFNLSLEKDLNDPVIRIFLPVK